jgi:hypothetical protein
MSEKPPNGRRASESREVVSQRILATLGDPLTLLDAPTGPRAPHQRGVGVGTKFWRRLRPTGFCWEWTGATTRSGYGTYMFDGYAFRAHRLVYELLVGPIPDGLTLDHLCRNKRCVNPDHLEPVTRGENSRRNLLGKRSELCKNGHRKGITRKGGYRVCRTCVNARARERYHASSTA